MKFHHSPGTPKDVIDQVRKLFENKEGEISGVYIMSEDEYKNAKKGGAFFLPDGDGKLDVQSLIMALGGGEALLKGILDVTVKKVGLTELPYNGIPGDSCSCNDCNMRRIIRGANPPEADEERDVSDEDKAALAKVEAERAAMAMKYATLPDVNPGTPEFEALPDDQKRLIKMVKLGMLVEEVKAHLDKMVATGEKTMALLRTVGTIMELVPEGKPITSEMKMYLEVSETLLMGLITKGFQRLFPDKEDKKD